MPNKAIFHDHVAWKRTNIITNTSFLNYCQPLCSLQTFKMSYLEHLEIVRILIEESWKYYLIMSSKVTVLFLTWKFIQSMKAFRLTLKVEIFNSHSLSKIIPSLNKKARSSMLFINICDVSLLTHYLFWIIHNWFSWSCFCYVPTPDTELRCVLISHYIRLKKPLISVIFVGWSHHYNLNLIVIKQLI